MSVATFKSPGATSGEWRQGWKTQVQGRHNLHW
jgi:hypothetical protein